MRENMPRLKDYVNICGWLYKIAGNISKRYSASIRRERKKFTAPFINPGSGGAESPVDNIAAKI
ncbi:MAG: hypothetical protein LBU18_07320 [Treponema sp.]|jgi:hypothetical protein|nr:hypothetical protein [Treponema sp.]